MSDEPLPGDAVHWVSYRADCALAAVLIAAIQDRPALLWFNTRFVRGATIAVLGLWARCRLEEGRLFEVVRAEDLPLLIG